MRCMRGIFLIEHSTPPQQCLLLCSSQIGNRAVINAALEVVCSQPRRASPGLLVSQLAYYKKNGLSTIKTPGVRVGMMDSLGVAENEKVIKFMNHVSQFCAL